METNIEIKAWEQVIRQIFEKAKTDKEYADRKITADWMINYIHGKVLPFEFDRLRRRSLYPVIERIEVMKHLLDIKEITGEDLNAIGNLVKHSFLSNGGLYIKTMRILEPAGAMIVNVYPSRFVPVIDAIIKKYFEEKV